MTEMIPGYSLQGKKLLSFFHKKTEIATEAIKKIKTNKTMFIPALTVTLSK